MTDSSSLTRIDLNGTWRVRQADTDECIPATVPGCVHMDLLAAGRIEDPFYRDNEDRQLWIGETDWVYSRSFDVAPDVLSAERVALRCEGLDTLAQIAINGTTVASTDNMFRTWEFDVKDVLCSGTNEIEIRFRSTLPVIRENQETRPIPSWGGPKEVKGRAWIRKEPCNYGWDWGPVIMTCGIWRDIKLVAVHAGRLTDVHVLQDHGTPGEVGLTVEAVAECAPGADLAVAVSASLAGETVAEGIAALCAGFRGVRLTVRNPQLWWPNNLGEQPLYDVDVRLVDANGSAIDSVTKRIGLRTLRLDRHPDQWGESFQFVVNGVPFFAKGANWIPADALLTRMTRADYARLIHATADGNMNMLRVWGGGIYEQDMFYELCDELGICIWQDFMFACSTYPTFDDAFMANVGEEFADNVRRMRHHPCIALWCGNNELEQGLVGDEWKGGQMSWADYKKLFDVLLPRVVGELDPERDYWPCSPHTPIGDRTNHADPTCGDAHLWAVWHGRQPFEWYRTCEHRFNSEFGFQSFPEPKTVRGYTEPRDRNVTTYVMEHHQRSGIGNTVIMQYMLDWFRLPTSFDMTLWLSQILHGMAMKYAVEHWRRSMPRGMGTLYWQLNDCWPVASWASIDYHGRWKALHYMARKFYSPLLVSVLEDMKAGTAEIHVTNDLRGDIRGDVRWALTDIQGSVIKSGTIPAAVVAGTNSRLDTLQLGEELETRGARGVLLWVDLCVDGDVVSSNLALFARPKHIELADAAIATSITALGDGSYKVALTAAAPVLWAWVELAETDATYSDNFVHLRPGVEADIVVRPAEPLTWEEFGSQLRVAHLTDTYG